MPINNQFVDVQQNTWVNIYAAAGIAIGTQITVENIGNSDIYLAVQELQPAKDHNNYSILKRPPSVSLRNSPGDVGAWAYCQGSAGKISVSTPSNEGFIPVIAQLNTVGGSIPVRLLDGFGNPINSLSGAINVHDADVHNYVVNKYVSRYSGLSTTLTADANIGDYIIQVSSVVGFAVGMHLEITDGYVENTYPIITQIVGNNLYLDRRLDHPYVIGDSVIEAIIDMSSTAATMASPLIYENGPLPGTVWHITRILLSMTHGTAGDLGLFGDLPPLLNGVALRGFIGGQYATLTNWHTSADIKDDMYDVEFNFRASGGGTHGTSGRGTFTNAGAVVRLDGTLGDKLQVIVQDDLTGLISFQLKMQGHTEGT